MALAATLGASFSLPASAQEVARAASPDGRVTVSVGLDPEGRPTYAIARNARPLIADSRLGFLFTDAPAMARGFAAKGISRNRVDLSWTQPWGEWRTIRDRHNELTVRFEEKGPLKRNLAVTFRVFDEGVGFRYTVADQPNLHRANIADELTEFNFAQPGTALWKPAYEHNREEYPYQRTSLDAVGTAQTVMTVEVADGTHAAVHEAALVDYSAMNLRRVTGTRFRASLTPAAGGASVVRQAGFSTPWRTIAIADDAPGLYAASRIGLNLNEPNTLGDVSWVRPGKFVGIWWNMISGVWTWGRGPLHGATSAHVRQYIDFAAANGIGGVLVEGWNIGWDGDWAANSSSVRFDQPTADFDAKALQLYAAARKVRLIGHHETNGAASHYDSQLDRAFGWARDHGISIVKTGYVADAGTIERVDPDGTRRREWHEGQWMVNHQLRVVTTAARYRIGVDGHEPVKDTGLRRTYPNWLTREGGRGMEYMSWADKNLPDHEANLVFTQMLGGPMDFTPGILSLKGSNNSDIPSTLAKQLALYVVIYSPVVMLADTPETYARYPGPLKFLRDVPTDWADTRVLAGEIGDYATIVRKDRDSDDWYLGAVGDELARSSTIRLDFLDPRRAYVAEIYRDGPDADYRTTARHSFVIERRSVRHGDSMTLTLAPGGGQAIRFVAQRRGKR